MNDPTNERIEGPTPNGGPYAVAHFRDEAGAPVPKSEAVSAEIIEYDAENREIFRTYGQLGSE